MGMERVFVLPPCRLGRAPRKKMCSPLPLCPPPFFWSGRVYSTSLTNVRPERGLVGTVELLQYLVGEQQKLFTCTMTSEDKSKRIILILDPQKYEYFADTVVEFACVGGICCATT